MKKNKSKFFSFTHYTKKTSFKKLYYAEIRHRLDTQTTYKKLSFSDYSLRIEFQILLFRKSVFLPSHYALP